MKTFSVRARLNLIFGIIIALILCFGLFIVTKNIQQRGYVRNIYLADEASYKISEATRHVATYLEWGRDEDLNEFVSLLDQTQAKLEESIETCRSIGDTQGLEVVEKIHKALVDSYSLREQLPKHMEKEANTEANVLAAFNRMLAAVDK